MMNDRCILITGTLVPNVSDLIEIDVERRRLEYLVALRFYRKVLDMPIYFLENSIYDLKSDNEFQAVFSSGVELMKFPPSALPEKGKGYQEFEILDLAVDRLSEQFNSIVKLTGRYVVENIKALADLPVNGLIADLHRKMEVAITGCFIADTTFYSAQISGLFEQCNDEKGDWIERVLYQKIKEEKLWSQVGLFPENPIYKGVPGSHVGTLERHPLKMKLRNAERKVLRALNMHQFPYEY